MHELSIAMNIADLADEEVKKLNAQKVVEIVIDLGSMSGVIKEALEFALNEGMPDTILKGAKITINEIPARSKCQQCHHEFETEDILNPCPKCGNMYCEIIQGKELILRSLVIE
jgi:hydrogenase nickel incorporation protein HypA/HybF